MGPCIEPSGRLTPSSPFQTIGEYFQWLLDVKRSSTTIGTTESDINAAHETLRGLESLLSEAILHFDSVLLRSVPSHEDFHAQNVLINDTGYITGVIDWEFHMIKPAVLVAAYPSWIRYDGSFDPRFVDRNGQFGYFWFCSPNEARQLCHEFDSVCGWESDPVASS